MHLGRVDDACRHQLRLTPSASLAQARYAAGGLERFRERNSNADPSPTTSKVPGSGANAATSWSQ